MGERWNRAWLRPAAVGAVAIAVSSPWLGAQVIFDGTINAGPNQEWGSAAASAFQTNYTGFGDQRLTPGGFPGSELDELFVRNDGTYLYIGVTGNLEQNGNSIVILLDTDLTPGVGQNPLRTEIAPRADELPGCSPNGPPRAVQGLGAALTMDDKSTPDTSDDERKRVSGSVGTRFESGFEPDHAIAVDTNGGGVFVTTYRLFSTPQGVWNDPSTPPGGLGNCQQAFQETLDYYSTRLYRGSGTVNSGNGLLTGGTTLEGLRVAFNNTGKLGVTGAAPVPPPPAGSTGLAGDPRSQTTGLEARIPLSALGLTPGGAVTVGLSVLLTGTDGYVTNQTLPPIGAGISTAALMFRPDFSTIATGGVSGDGNQFSVVTRSAAAFSGTINGIGIVSDFALANLVASQDTVTGAGDRNCLAPTSGSELDEVFVRLGAYDAENDNQFLYVGVTGNLATDGNAVVLMLDTDTTAGTGQNTLRTEIAPTAGDMTCPSNGPPYAVQNLGRSLITDNKGDADPANDERVPDTMVTPAVLDNAAGGSAVDFEPDYAIAVDAFGGTVSVTQYDLFAASQGTWDDPETPPGGVGDCTQPFQEMLPYLATRINRGQVPQSSGSGVLSGGTNPNGSQFAFDNTGTAGVTFSAVAAPGSNAPGDPRSQTKGLEAKISLKDLGVALPATDPLNLRVSVLLLGGGGLVSNQTLPPVNASPTVSTTHLGMRPDFNAVSGDQFVPLSLSPSAFDPAIDGRQIVADFGLPPVASQTTTTSFGDTTLTPVPDCDQALQKGSELDGIWVQPGIAPDTLAAAVEIAVTGNLEDNGNNLVIFFDTVENAGESLLAGNPGRLSGNNGDTLPCAAEYAVLVNLFGGNVYVDFFDLVNNQATFIGEDPLSGGDGVLQNGGNAINDWRLILNNTNLLGVNSTAAQDPQAANAATATTGLELSIPLATVGGTAEGSVSVFAMITGNGGDRYLSNQFLPPLASGGQANFGTGNPGGSRTNLANLGYTCLSVPLAGDCNDPRYDADSDGDTDQDDFAAFQRCRTSNGPADPQNPLYDRQLCECFDFGGFGADGAIDGQDFSLFLRCARGSVLDGINGSGPGIAADPDCDNP